MDYRKGKERGERNGKSELITQPKNVTAYCLQETLFILKNAGFFRTTAAGVFQVQFRTKLSPQITMYMHKGNNFTAQQGDALPSGLQVIDTASSRLQNVITFVNGASFVVDSKLQKEGPQRLAFQFSAAKLNLPSRTWQLPPFGKGWSVLSDRPCNPSRSHQAVFM